MVDGVVVDRVVDGVVDGVVVERVVVVDGINASINPHRSSITRVSTVTRINRSRSNRSPILVRVSLRMSKRDVDEVDDADDPDEPVFNGVHESEDSEGVCGGGKMLSL